MSGIIYMDNEAWRKRDKMIGLAKYIYAASKVSIMGAGLIFTYLTSLMWFNFSVVVQEDWVCNNRKRSEIAVRETEMLYESLSVVTAFIY